MPHKIQVYKNVDFKPLHKFPNVTTGMDMLRIPIPSFHKNRIVFITLQRIR